MHEDSFVLQLITLLAACNGVSEGLRLVAIFDKEYQRLWRPLDVRVRVRHDDYQEQVVHVDWGDAPLAEFINDFRGRTGHMRVEYTLEVVPPAPEAPYKNHLYRRTVPGGAGCEGDVEEDGGGKDCLEGSFPLLDPSMKDVTEQFKYHDTFYGVELERPKVRPGSTASVAAAAAAASPAERNSAGGGAGMRPKLVHQPVSVRTLAGGDLYFGGLAGGVGGEEGGGGGSKGKEGPKVTISTEVNGRTIAQRTEKIPPPPVPPMAPTPAFHTRGRTFFCEEEEDEACRIQSAGEKGRKQSVPGEESGGKVIKDQVHGTGVHIL